MLFLFQEIAEPLMDLKKGIEELLVNKTFKYILSAVLAIGSFLNGTQVRKERISLVMFFAFTNILKDMVNGKMPCICLSYKKYWSS